MTPRPIGTEAWHPRLGKVVVASEPFQTIGGGLYIRVRAPGRAILVDVPASSLGSNPSNQMPEWR